MEREGLRAAIAFIRADVIDPQRWQIVVLNCSKALPVRYCSSVNVCYLHEESLIWFNGGIAVDYNCERIGHLTGGDDLVRQSLRDIIAVGSGRCAVLR